MTPKDYMIQTYCEKYDEGEEDYDIFEEWDYHHRQYVDKYLSDYSPHEYPEVWE